MADADVVVIGAGAAGLAAARKLAAAALRVIVLEARDRIGGRVWPIRPPASDTVTELGAEFIHGPALETRALLREAGTAAVDTSGDGWICRAGAEPRPDDFALPAAALFERVSGLAADESVDGFLQRFGGEPGMRDAVERARAFAEGFDAVDPAIASVRAIAEEWRSGVDSTSARPIGGYAPMLERLRDALAAAGVQTQLSTPVRRIAWRRGSVTVDAVDRSGAERTVRARAAIVTIPVGVLRAADAVAFDPPLPPAKHAALEHIEMGQVVKIGLWFRTAFWERLRGGRYRDAGFFHCSGMTFPAYWTRVPVRTEQIVAWAGGTRATALRGVPEPELIERALDGFGAALGEGALARREFVDGVMHDWDRDPYARGAYSYIAVGGAGARSALGAALDEVLFFAGEATSLDGQGGTVNGALETGERAAREAVAVLARDGR